MDDIINITVAIPKPIRFQYGDSEYVVDGRISMGKALHLRRVSGEFEDKRSAMLEALAAATEDGATPDLVVAAEAAVVEFESAAEEVEALVNALFRETNPNMDPVKFGWNEIGQVAAVIWQRAFGAPDEALLQLADQDGEVPPTRTQSRSTSPNGSTRSAKPTAGRPRSGSRSR